MARMSHCYVLKEQTWRHLGQEALARLRIIQLGQWHSKVPGEAAFSCKDLVKNVGYHGQPWLDFVSWSLPRNHCSPGIMNHPAGLLHVFRKASIYTSANYTATIRMVKSIFESCMYRCNKRLAPSVMGRLWSYSGCASGGLALTNI